MKKITSMIPFYSHGLVFFFTFQRFRCPRIYCFCKCDETKKEKADFQISPVKLTTSQLENKEFMAQEAEQQRMFQVKIVGLGEIITNETSDLYKSLF